MAILVQLENYYRKCGIQPAGENFRCPRFGACRGGMKLTPPTATLNSKWRNTFTPGFSAFVGARYEDARPRLLFVALDVGTVLRDDDLGYNYAPPESRTPPGIRGMHERLMSLITNGTDTARRPTLRGMNQFAKAVLQGLPGIPVGEVDYIRFCARVNAVKCCMNKEKRAQADRRLYENCRDMNYLREELEILAPHVIVSLGGRAKKAVEFAFSTSSEWTREQALSLRNGEEATWFPSYHPARPGYYNKQEGARNQFVARLRARFSK